MLLDIDEVAMDLYSQQGVADVPFPLGYLIDKKGIIRHIYINEEPKDELLKTHIEALIAE